ncbi:unnamed protein product, partial [Thlaspi arvense]
MIVHYGKTLIELFDETIVMNIYTTKNHNSFGKEYMVEKFNSVFNINITYGYFKNKLDEFKKNCKRWKALMSFIGILVDPATSMIYASDAWWKERELRCKIIKVFNRKPPYFWNVMREDDLRGSDTDSGDMLETQIPETQE